MDVIKLRPHHALCIQTYAGKGYNREFVNNMDHIVNVLETKNPDILLINECDRICSYCPHKKENICNQEKKVYSYDKKVLELINTDFNSVISWHELDSKIKNNILPNIKYDEVCKGCSWISTCTSIHNSKSYKN